MSSAGDREREREEGKPCKYAEAEFLVETEDSNDSEREREREGGDAGQKRMGANGVGHKVFAVLFLFVCPFKFK